MILTICRQMHNTGLVLITLWLRLTASLIFVVSRPIMGINFSNGGATLISPNRYCRDFSVICENNP